MIPELSCHLRTMVRKSKSILFGHILRIFKKNGVSRPLPPKFFLSFLAESDISKSFETNFFSSKKNPLDFAFDT